MPAKRTHQQFLIELDQHNQKYPDAYLKLGKDQTYINVDVKLQFQCNEGHQPFFTSPRHILQKHSGCSRCGAKRTAHKNTKTAVSFQQQLDARNQRCVNKVYLCAGQVYKTTTTPLQFLCDKEHTFSTIPKTILMGHGCKQCGLDQIRTAHRYTHQEFEKLLVRHNQQHSLKTVFLQEGQQYTGFRDPLAFTCAHDHTWMTTPDNIFNGGAGCPFCASSKTFSLMAIEWLQSIEQRDHITIHHRGNNNKEFVIPGTKYTVDEYCSDTNTVYEFHGNYWHGNPRMFSATDINERTKTTFGQLHKATIAKEQKIRELNYNLVVMWEDEYNANKDAGVLLAQFENMKTELGANVVMIPINTPYDRYTYSTQHQQAAKNNVSTFFIFYDEWATNPHLIQRKLTHYSQSSIAERIHARNCSIRLVTNAEKRELLNVNHMQGNDKAQISYGAYYNNKLVAVMTFATPRIALGAKCNKDQTGMWELSRFCTDTNFRIPGIASKLLTHFTRNHHWKEIYSYADKRWSVGNMYHQLGFTLVADNPPDYFYVVNGVRKHRWNYRKDILKNTLPNYDPTLTEYQNMVNHGFWRVWDCGTLKFSMVNHQKSHAYAIPS